jgi:hypothetical protein
MYFFRTKIKWLLSFIKSNWNFDDYPIRTWKNPNAGVAKVAYGAGIINWSLMVGHGETYGKAVENLKKDFELYKKRNPSVPRPGTYVPIKYASTKQIDKYKDIAIDFFNKVLEQDYSKGFYSDEACLWPIGGPDKEKAKKVKAEIINRTLRIYGVDITEIYDNPLYQIFEVIKQKQADLLK